MGYGEAVPPNRLFCMVLSPSQDIYSSYMLGNKEFHSEDQKIFWDLTGWTIYSQGRIQSWTFGGPLLFLSCEEFLNSIVFYRKCCRLGAPDPLNPPLFIIHGSIRGELRQFSLKRMAFWPFNQLLLKKGHGKYFSHFSSSMADFWPTFLHFWQYWGGRDAPYRNNYQIEPKIFLNLFSNFSDLEPKYSYQLYSMTSLGATYTIFYKEPRLWPTSKISLLFDLLL